MAGFYSSTFFFPLSVWDVRLDNRITLGGFKKEIETVINVHRDYFKILKIYTSNQVSIPLGCTLDRETYINRLKWL